MQMDTRRQLENDFQQARVSADKGLEAVNELSSARATIATLQVISSSLMTMLHQLCCYLSCLQPVQSYLPDRYACTKLHSQISRRLLHYVQMPHKLFESGL